MSEYAGEQFKERGLVLEVEGEMPAKRGAGAHGLDVAFRRGGATDVRRPAASDLACHGQRHVLVRR